MKARLKLSSTRKGSESGDPESESKNEPQTDSGSGARLLKQGKAATATTPPKKHKWRTMRTARKPESKPAADPGSWRTMQTARKPESKPAADPGLETRNSEPDSQEARLSEGRKKKRSRDSGEPESEFEC